MRISDWSSDVCSSDLDQPLALQVHHGHGAAAVLGHLRRLVAGAVAAVEAGEQPLADAAGAAEEGMANGGEVVERAGGEHERHSRSDQGRMEPRRDSILPDRKRTRLKSSN